MSLGTFSLEGPFETRLFINNEFRDSLSGSTFATVNPCTEEVIAHVQAANEEDVDAAVLAAEAAFKTWKDVSPSDRRNLLWRLAQLVEDNVEYLAKLESLDNGKPFATSGYGSRSDLSLVINCFRYYAGWCEKIQGKTIPVDGPYLCMTRHEPIGVVGQIIPWNFPLLMLSWKLGPALATGNTIVMKTSEKTPLSALAIAKLIVEAGFPPGVVNILSGFGPQAGSPLVSHMKVDKIAFTGSTATGRHIMRDAAGSNLKRTSLELGGKSPLIVFPDADIDEAVKIAETGLFLNQGQCCCASSRLYVHEDVYDKFVAAAVASAKARVVGAPWEESVSHGPVVDKLQFDRVMHFVDLGVKEGATVACGGEKVGEKGFFIPPTIFTDVTDNMTIAREEIFGPVMCVLKFKDFDEVIARANDSEYGLAAGIITRDIGVAMKAATQVRAGTVWVNCYNMFHHNAPFGGYKMSGTGRELGEYALELYSEVKTIWIPLDRTEPKC